jgi:carboxypeptidase PM20D1
MASLRKTALLAGGVILALGAVVAVRTVTFQPPGGADFSQIKLATPPAIDQALAAQHLSQAIQIPTISHQNPADNQREQWTRLHDWLASTYPASHAAMTREIVLNNALSILGKAATPPSPRSS